MKAEYSEKMTDIAAYLAIILNSLLAEKAW